MWVWKTPERLADEDYMGALGAGAGKRWKTAQAAASAELRGLSKLFSHACETLPANLDQRRASWRKLVGRVRRPLARAKSAFEPLSFEVPTGLRCIDGRPVQACMSRIPSRVSRPRGILWRARGWVRQVIRQVNWDGGGRSDRCQWVCELTEPVTTGPNDLWGLRSRGSQLPQHFCFVAAVWAAPAWEH